MKAGIHPTYFPDAVVSCTCGNTFTTGSTKDAIHVDICWKCHPLWTGEQKFIDTLGQVGKFEEKMKAAQQYKSTLSAKKDKKDKLSQKPKSLRELLLDM